MTEVIAAVEAEVKKVEGEVVAVAEKVEAAVEKVVEKVMQELTADEKLVIREIENTYLKAQIEITRLTQITTKAQGDFTKAVEGFTKKYAVDPTSWFFDNVELIFKKK